MKAQRIQACNLKAAKDQVYGGPATNATKDQVHRAASNAPLDYASLLAGSVSENDF